MDHYSSKCEGHHGAHYWCPGCWNSNVSVVVRGGIAVAVSPTKAGLGSLVTKTSVPGRANLNASGTERITTTREKKHQT